MDFDNKSIFDYNREYGKVGYKSNVQPLKGLRELIAKGIIYPHSLPGIWWMNPTIVCKGERFAVYTEWVTKERHERDAKRQTRRQELSEQGQEWYESLDDDTQYKLDQMEKHEERNNPMSE
ncbi:Uncharacterised protein [Chlamydia trachomatis]|nr:Uncharacterised protein [Chlamydia trachomatis]